MYNEKTGIIFDIDGTLWDSSEKVAESFQEVVDRYPDIDAHVTGELILRNMGKTMTDFALGVFPEIPPEKRTPLMEECEAFEIEYILSHPPLAYPGTVETLRSLSERFPLFIVSNCQAGYIEAFIEITGISDLIKDFISFGDNHLQKGQNIRLIAERNNLNTYFYVGDIQADYDATIAGGGNFIHAAYGFGSVKQDVPRISDIKELPGLMSSFFC